MKIIKTIGIIKECPMCSGCGAWHKKSNKPCYKMLTTTKCKKKQVICPLCNGEPGIVI
jgi:hypothetical protein